MFDDQARSKVSLSKAHASSVAPPCGKQVPSEVTHVCIHVVRVCMRVCMCLCMQKSESSTWTVVYVMWNEEYLQQKVMSGRPTTEHVSCHSCVLWRKYPKCTWSFKIRLSSGYINVEKRAFCYFLGYINTLCHLVCPFKRSSRRAAPKEPVVGGLHADSCSCCCVCMYVCMYVWLYVWSVSLCASMHTAIQNGQNIGRHDTFPSTEGMVTAFVSGYA